MSIAIVPGAFVQIVFVGWDETVHQHREILLQTGFKLDRSDSRSAPDDMHMYQSVLYARTHHNGCYVICKILQIPVSVRVAPERFLIHVHGH